MSKPYDGTPGEGQFVEFDHLGETLCGMVTNTVVDGDWISIFVTVSPTRSIIIGWSQARACQIPADWKSRFAA
jgi:hypothetical protein